MPPPSLPGIDFGTRRFLVVDDFDSMRNILRELLRRCGARNIDVAANGPDAITAVMRNRYDVVLCDYHLGRGKNGQQVLEECRSKKLIGPATVWAMITAEKTSDMVMCAAEHQPDDYLIKPLTEAMLTSRLSRLVARKSLMSSIETAVRAKEYTRAIALCDKRLAEEPVNDAQVARQRCELLILLGDYERAKEGFERQLAIRDTPWAMVGLAKLHFREKEYAKARVLLEQALEQNRTYIEGYDCLAQTLTQMGEHQEAQAVLTRATMLSPNSPSRQQALGEVSLQCQDLDVAEQAYRKAVNLGVNSDLKTPKAYLGLAKVHTEKGNTKEAFSVLGRLTQDIPGDDAKFQAKAAEVRVHAKNGDHEAVQRCAEELASRMQTISTDLPPATTLELAETLLELGHKEMGSQFIQQVVLNNHDDDTLVSHAEQLFQQAGMTEEGAQILDSTRSEAIEIMNKGVSLATHGKIDEGIQFLRDAKALMPNSPRLLLNLAYLLITRMESSGRHSAMVTEARRYIEQAKKYTHDQQRCGKLLAKLERLG